MKFIELAKGDKTYIIMTDKITAIEKMDNGNCNIFLESGHLIKDVESYDIIKEIIRTSK